MRNWLQNMAARLGYWMQGRYGNDELNKTLLITAVVLAVLSYFPYLGILSLAALGLLVWINFRSLSKNVWKRQAELQTYYRIKNKVKTAVSLRRRMWRERRTHRYVKCKHCRAVLRVPKGRGQVEVGCPRCKGNAFYRT